MNKEQMARFIGNEEMTIVDAMTKIDTNAKGIIFITDKNDCLVGSLTDGDIRRWLIRTGDLKASVANVMKNSPVYLYVQEKNRAKDIMDMKKVTALPLLNNDRQIEEIIMLSDASLPTRKDKTLSLRGVPVIIMAGGKGTRLYPYTKILPKPLIPIGDTPIIERIINRFTEYGINYYYISVNYKKGMIKAYFSDLCPDYKLNFVEEDKSLGTGGSIKLIKEKLQNPIFVANCDSLILADYADLYRYHKDSGNAITIVSAVKNIVIPYGVLNVNANGEFVSMDEKPRLSYFINTGMYVINPDLIDLIPDDVVFHMTDLVTAVKEIGGKVGVYPVSEDSFLDMGEFNEMHRMEDKLNV